jgi:hypothetical protein
MQEEPEQFHTENLLELGAGLACHQSVVVAHSSRQGGKLLGPGHHHHRGPSFKTTSDTALRNAIAVSRDSINN